MTDKIKSAREEMPSPFTDDNMTVGEFREKALKWLGDYYFEIAEALSIYERLQGVDGMKKDTTNHQELLAKCDDLTVGYNDGYNQAIDDVKAQLVADIGKDR